MFDPVQLTGFFIALCFVAFIVFWIVTGLSTKRTVRRRGWWRVSFALITLAFILARIGLFRVHWVSGFLWHTTLFTGLMADAIALAGLAVLLWARVNLGGNWSADVALKEGHELVTSGPYRFVRHPIYSGLLLMALGWAVWRGRYSGFWGLAVLLLLFWIKAREEEKLMIQHFGDAYRSYKTRVKAIIPYVV